MRPTSSDEKKYHDPVMLSEVLEYLDPKEGKKYIDCTLGDGGHTLALLEKGAKVLGLEVYPLALERAQARIDSAGYAENFVGTNGNFKNLLEIAEKMGFDCIDGVLFDLGYSSYELEETEIGLSFQKIEPLDMRLDPNLGVTAADLVNSLPEEQLSKIISTYGGEKLARKFAHEIVKARSVKKFQTTKDLSDLIVSVAPSSYEHGRINPSTRTFQALRIAVNDELENFKNALPQAARVLLPGGRMVIITFHSLEDKIAKNFGDNVQLKGLEATFKKPLIPSAEEVAKNPRARSAKVRVYERYKNNDHM